MSIDFTQCQICSPVGRQLMGMYKTLWEIFPYDRPVYEEMISSGAQLYTLTNYALYCGDRFLGNAGLIPMKVHMGGNIVDIIGVGAVATVPQYRKQGIARYLMRHCMNIVDSQQRHSILFTELPAVYEHHGFSAVSQVYKGVYAEALKFKHAGFACRLISILQDDQIEKMSEVYDRKFPAYTGKVVRDQSYWRLYKMLFNPYPKPRIVMCFDGENLKGYMRFETEDDRFTITEVCTAPEEREVTETLLAFMLDTLDGNDRFITFALNPQHHVFRMLNHKGAMVTNEPEGVRREIFMARSAVGQKLGSLGHMQWSLADKF